MSKKTNLYTEDSIQSLEPLEFVRLRPSVYCGSVEYSTQLMIELLANSIDEFQIGNANKVIIETLPNNTYSLTDDGQGILVNQVRPEDGKTVLESAFSVLNTSGKYDADGVYEGNVIGLNGIGSKLATYLSHTLEVISYRDGKFEHIWFKEGKFVKREIGKWNKGSGIKVIWQPSEEFFIHPEVEENKIINLIKSTVCLCQGLTIIYNNETYQSKNGLDDMLDEIVGKEEILKNRLHIKHQSGKHKLDLSLTYANSYSSNITPYVNTGFTSSGPHITQIKTILTRELNKFFRDKKWLKEKDANLSGDDIHEGLCLVFHIITTGVGYDGQLKDRITKLDMTPFTEVITTEIREWLERNEKEIKQIADKALNARKAREAAKKAREAVRQPKEKKKQFLNLPSKLVDCWSKDRSKCELIICEGDSAAGGLVEARDAEIAAIFPVRGKLIAAYKNTTEKIFANQEVANLIKAIGLELDSKTNKLIYDKKKLRYGKILLAADAK